MFKKCLCILVFVELFCFNSANANEKTTGLPQLDFSTYPSLIFWSVLSLIVLYLLMSLIVTPKISVSLNNREQNIQNNLMKAKSIKEDSDLILEKLNKEEEEARSKARNLIEQSIKESKINLEKIDQQITEKINLQINTTLKKLNSEKESKIDELIKNSSSISEMVIKKIADIEVNKDTLEKIINKTSKSVVKDYKNGI
tara:strand:- start:199 stop:795 length:597 start_codon:yes stop_codon:yes gene_type:complete